jgi:hypothetical protein
MTMNRILAIIFNLLFLFFVSWECDISNCHFAEVLRAFKISKIMFESSRVCRRLRELAGNYNNVNCSFLEYIISRGVGSRGCGHHLIR